jgi:protein gp37
MSFLLCRSGRFSSPRRVRSLCCAACPCQPRYHLAPGVFSQVLTGRVLILRQACQDAGGVKLVADKSKIEWTDATWNPTTGCTKVSQGCKNCYAETLARRLQRMGSRNYANGFALALQPHMLEVPIHWRQPRRIFVNSMSDVFHEDVPDVYVAQIFEVMERADWHIYQLLTKRPERLARFVRARYGGATPPSHIWLGTSVEDARVVSRIRYLQNTPATVRFLSCEPLIGPLPELDLDGIHWVIVGGESGRRHRPMDPAWVRDIRRQCRARRVPFFFKQWGGAVSKSGGRILDGRTWNQQPRTLSRAVTVSVSA